MAFCFFVYFRILPCSLLRAFHLSISSVALYASFYGPYTLAYVHVTASATRYDEAICVASMLLSPIIQSLFWLLHSLRVALNLYKMQPNACVAKAAVRFHHRFHNSRTIPHMARERDMQQRNSATFAARKTSVQWLACRSTRHSMAKAAVS